MILASCFLFLSCIFYKTFKKNINLLNSEDAFFAFDSERFLRGREGRNFQYFNCKSMTYHFPENSTKVFSSHGNRHGTERNARNATIDNENRKFCFSASDAQESSDRITLVHGNWIVGVTKQKWEIFL